MSRCSFCKKKKEPGRGTFFNVPEDEKRRKRWSKICGMQLSASSLLCGEHFLASDIIKAGRKFFLMPNAKPFIRSLHRYAVNAIKQPGTTTAVVTRNSDQTTYENSKGVYGENLFIINNNIPPTQLQLKPAVQVSCFKPASTQTNLRLCGTVQVSDFGDEYRFNCFYCCETFPVEKWEKFISHLKNNHFEAFQIPIHDTNDHDLIIQESPKKQTFKKQYKNTQKSDQKQTSNKTALSRCLKRSNIVETLDADEGKISTTESFLQKPTELSFEYTPRHIIDFLLDNMKNYPILWKFDEVPFNEDYYEAIEELCQIINDKWSLNIDTLHLRRSVNRVLNFYCSLYPCDNVENINQFANYYDKCAKFLPESVNDIAYARCCHCYGCYQNNSELRSHLLEEHKYLQWPYKCVQCNEFFRDNDEFELHKRLPHYEEKIVESTYTYPLSLDSFNPLEENKPVTFEIESQFNDSDNTVNNESKTFVLPKNSEIEKEKPFKNRTMKQSSKNQSKNTQKSNIKQTSNKTALSRCLKRSNTIETEADEGKICTIESFLEKSTELSFEYSPQEIIEFLLDNMKNYSVLWKYDEMPFNENYYEAIEELCQIIYDKWSLNIDTLHLRRSVNRVLNFYCSLYPCENINKFANYYDKCTEFLPPSVHDIAYARCSHCYRCYENNSELRSHLVEENKYLQWPYKCVQCKECFRDSDEFEFHKRLPHYEEVFRCKQCNKQFTNRHRYKEHVTLHQISESDEPGKHVCNICGKAFKRTNMLSAHKVYHQEKKLKCHLCPKSFITNASLKRHLKIHTKEYDCMCEVCGKKCADRNNLKQHMNKHTGAKVTCNICNLKLRKSSLSRHLRLVHVACEGTLETTYRAKNFHYRRLLVPQRCGFRNKKKIDRNYICKICEITFESLKPLREHNKEFHSDAPKWSCKLCGSEYKCKSNLKYHYRDKHKLHIYQIFKLIEDNEDLNTVLAIKPEELDKLEETLAYSLIESNYAKKPVHTTMVKSVPSANEIYIEEERIQSDTMQNEVMKAHNIDDEIKIDDDFLTNLPN